MTPPGIEPATFRFVTQHLNHCATAVPKNCVITSFFRLPTRCKNVEISLQILQPRLSYLQILTPFIFSCLYFVKFWSLSTCFVNNVNKNLKYVCTLSCLFHSNLNLNKITHHNLSTVMGSKLLV